MCVQEGGGARGCSAHQGGGAGSAPPAYPIAAPAAAGPAWRQRPSRAYRGAGGRGRPLERPPALPLPGVVGVSFPGAAHSPPQAPAARGAHALAPTHAAASAASPPHAHLEPRNARAVALPKRRVQRLARAGRRTRALRAAGLRRARGRVLRRKRCGRGRARQGSGRFGQGQSAARARTHAQCRSSGRFAAALCIRVAARRRGRRRRYQPNNLSAARSALKRRSRAPRRGASTTSGRLERWIARTECVCCVIGLHGDGSAH